MDMFERTLPLVGEEGIKKLRGAHVAVFGLGGVGSYAAEALAARAWAVLRWWTTT